MKSINIGIVGYGNLGKAVECEIEKNSDMRLVAIFTRREDIKIKLAHRGVKVIKFNEILNYVNDIDVMILCGGSTSDLKYQSQLLANSYNIVDSFDTHEKINEHFERVNSSAKKSGKTAIVSTGWDPGLFSIVRLISESILLNGNSYTFWGKGVSQGHSEAIRAIEGVKDAIQYTVPIDEAMRRVRNHENPDLEAHDKHIRECYVAIDNKYDKSIIEEKIKNMPYYFQPYTTTVNFVTEDEVKKRKEKMNHGGFVFRSGITGKNDENNNIIEFSLKLDSNPYFTANVLIAYARAAYRLNKEGQRGAKSVLDIPLSYLLINNKREEINKFL